MRGLLGEHAVQRIDSDTALAHTNNLVHEIIEHDAVERTIANDPLLDEASTLAAPLGRHDTRRAIVSTSVQGHVLHRAAQTCELGFVEGAQRLQGRRLQRHCGRVWASSDCQRLLAAKHEVVDSRHLDHFALITKGVGFAGRLVENNAGAG